MAHDLLTRESPEITQFFQDIGHITELLKLLLSTPNTYAKSPPGNSAALPKKPWYMIRPTNMHWKFLNLIPLH